MNERDQQLRAAPALRQKADSAASGAMMKRSQPPEKWLSEIEELVKQGRMDEARQSFAEFVKRHPDYPIPPVLRDSVTP